MHACAHVFYHAHMYSILPGHLPGQTKRKSESHQVIAWRLSLFCLIANLLA